MKLINATGERSKLGRVVKQSSKQRNAFVYASLDEIAKVFIIAEDGVPNGAECVVVNSGITKVFVKGEIKRGDNIRSRRNWDSKDAGACYISKAEDIPYINIGVALEDGKNQLVDTALSIYYERLVDTAWDDIRVPLTSLRVGSANPPAFERFRRNTGGTSEGVYAWFFDKATEEELFFALQMPHDYKYGTDLHGHVHWGVDTAPAGSTYVIWGLEYTFAQIGDTFGVTQTTVTDATDPVTQYEHLLTEFNTNVDGSAVNTVSSMLLGRVYRDADDGDDTFDDDACLFEVDFHYQKDSFGSRTEYTK
jgi:hypothetical protein